MLEIIRNAPDSVVLKGRLDAVQADKAFAEFDALEGTCTVYFDDLEYISSAGLSVLLHTQQRLSQSGGSIKLAGLNANVKQVFVYAGFDTIFEII